MKTHTLSVSLLMLVGLIAFSAPGQAEEVTITPTKLTDQIYMLVGQGGNIGLFIGDDGTFMIDDQFAPLTDKILAAITSVGGAHPKFLINTHYHGDHTGGNEKLGRGGTLIFSHDNVRERLVQGSYIGAFNMKNAPTGKAGLPVVTFAEEIRFHLNSDTVHVYHVPHAHTDGDSFIVFETANVIHAGDFFFNGLYPFIDVGHGGTLKGMIKAVNEVLSHTDGTTQIIPGHGPLADRGALIRYGEMLATAYQRLSRLKAEGTSVQEAVAAKPLADLEDTWGKGMFTGDRWIELIYAGV